MYIVNKKIYSQKNLLLYLFIYSNKNRNKNTNFKEIGFMFIRPLFNRPKKMSI